MKVAGPVYRAAIDLNRAARRVGADIVHTNGLKAHAIGLLARRLGGRPTIIHIRDIANTSFERWMWKSFQIASDHTIFVSRACWPDKLLPANSNVVYNGLRVPPAIPERRQSPRLLIGFVGRIHPAKGLHVLIEALAKLRAENCEAELLVRGAFAAETPHYEREIQDQIDRLGLSDRITFAGFASGLDNIYDRMTVVCVPSITPDPLPRAVMEAMGLGLAVIATPCGGIPEMIEHRRSGFLASDADGIGHRAHERCAELFAMNRLHENVFRIYERIIGKTS
jgi:glycosyltransferase involved in cell wall biosynthesis